MTGLTVALMIGVGIIVCGLAVMWSAATTDDLEDR